MPPSTGPLIDRYGRVATDLRVSLTDRCNLRCTYCMPAEGMSWLPGKQLLHSDEIIRLVRIGVTRLGVSRVWFTGGEPLLDRHLKQIVAVALVTAATTALRIASDPELGHDLAKLFERGHRRGEIRPDIRPLLHRTATGRRLLPDPGALGQRRPRTVRPARRARRIGWARSARRTGHLIAPPLHRPARERCSGTASFDVITIAPS